MSRRCTLASKRNVRLLGSVAGVLATTVPFVVAEAATVKNPLCPTETALFNPDNGQDIVVPQGFRVSVFASGLNMPTGLAFLKRGGGDGDDGGGGGGTFEVYVLESGHGLPSICNDQSKFGTGDFDPKNPFTPDILVFNQNGAKIRTLAKPTAMPFASRPRITR